MLATTGRGHRLRRRRALSLSIGWFAALVLGASWAHKELFWWPAFGTARPDAPLFPPAPILVVEELLGLAAACWVWMRFGLRDGERRRGFLRTGRLADRRGRGVIIFGPARADGDQSRRSVAGPHRRTARRHRARASGRDRRSPGGGAGAAGCEPVRWRGRVRPRQAIADRHGLPVDVDDRLIELDYGDWDGVALRDVPAAEWAAWRADPTFAPPGGESLVAVTGTRRVVLHRGAPRRGRRGRRGQPRVADQGRGLLGARHRRGRASWRMQLGVAAVTRIGARPDGGPYLHSFNETAHVLAASRDLRPNESHESGASA